ncbi:CLUMA_CG005929, isoform A [Clunio marinus]|uniref:CLUMA_CG005929, isoform A n=1 Tax=Clunio marinus TaxID=568069 RepID=A0A1J1I0L0_9DIPT|nr:CLUMA_CG005929, isoform A [Clunio marinus]
MNIDFHYVNTMLNIFPEAAEIKTQKTASSTVMTSTTRDPKIMHGFPTRDGEFGWQASLELFHPSLGFIGHWCGGVLIHKYWVLSSAHCIHNDLFNLPLPALWTIVLGENNRKVESGYEQRISVDKIIMHEKYRHFKNDLVLMKLGRAANLSPMSRVKTIQLSSTSHIHVNPNASPMSAMNLDNDLFERNENYLRSLDLNVNDLAKKIAQVNKNEIKSRQRQGTNKIQMRLEGEDTNSTKVVKVTKKFRRNDKFLHRRPTTSDDQYWLNRENFTPTSSIDYVDCVAVGWGKYRNRGDLSDILLKIQVPIQDIKRCEEVYSDFVSLHQNQHLCAGNMDGKGGTCVGDSGGGLQCRTHKNGPWTLVGITSFGSGCAKAGYPDVFTRISWYRNWIDNAIQNN